VQKLWLYACGLSITALALGIGNSGRLEAQEAVLPESVRNALARFAEVKTFSVSWSVRRQVGEMVRTNQKPSPWNPQVLAGLEFHLLVWQDGKMYERIIEGGREWKNDPSIRRSESAFDGRILATGNPDSDRKKNRKPSIVVKRAEDLKPWESVFGVELFEPLGIRLPHEADELRHAKSLSSQVLFLLEHGGRLEAFGPAEIDGRSLTRIAIHAPNPEWPSTQKVDYAKLERTLRVAQLSEAEIQEKLAITKRRVEFTPQTLEYVYYLDPSFGYCVRRCQVRNTDGQLRLQWDCTGAERLEGHQIWLPRKWVTDFYSWRNYPGEFFDKPFVSEVQEVQEFSTKPVADERFELKYTEPGTVVGDHTLPESKLGAGEVHYQIPANPEDLDRAIEEARALRRAQAEGATWAKKYKAVSIIVTVLVVAGVLAYLVIRHRRKGATS
jgi:hypothetical protein